MWEYATLFLCGLNRNKQQRSRGTLISDTSFPYTLSVESARISFHQLRKGAVSLSAGQDVFLLLRNSTVRCVYKGSKWTLSWPSSIQSISSHHTVCRVQNFLFSSSSRPALGPTQPPIQWVLGVKRPGCEANHSLPASAEVNKIWMYIATAPYAFMA
jgi:hypothetical protein